MFTGRTDHSKQIHYFKIYETTAPSCVSTKYHSLHVILLAFMTGAINFGADLLIKFHKTDEHTANVLFFFCNSRKLSLGGGGAAWICQAAKNNLYPCLIIIYT